MDTNTDVAQSKVFLDLLLDRLLEEEIFLRLEFCRLSLEICFMVKILRVLLEMLLAPLMIEAFRCCITHMALYWSPQKIQPRA
jgi:hypothetical protein